jgi:hypothetical protein
MLILFAGTKSKTVGSFCIVKTPLQRTVIRLSFCCSSPQLSVYILWRETVEHTIYKDSELSDKLHCKCEMLVQNDLSPHSVEMLLNDLKDETFCCCN